MTSVLIVDRDPFALETIRHQFDVYGCGTAVASNIEEARQVIDEKGESFSGLIVNVEIGDGASGWQLARRMRELNPAVAIGYLSATGHRDWAAKGVPDSVMINMPGGDLDIPEDFFRLCHAGRPEGGESPSGKERLADVIQRERDALQDHFQRTPSFIAFLEGPEHCFTFANQSYVRLVEREVVGLTVVEAFPEAVAQGFVDILDRVYNNGEDFVAHGVEFRIQINETETKTTYIDLIYRPVRTPDGRIHGIFVEGEDLTARRENEQRIAQLQNELIYIARINAMGLLASTLAHELNQPLASVQNFVAAATILTQRQSADPEILACLADASRSAMRAGDIIRRLRAMTVRRSVRQETIDIESALREAVATACIGSTVRVDYELGWTGMVRADLVQLQQVVLNLVQNAIYAAGADLPRLCVSTADEGSLVRCCIRDWGSGIAPAILPRLFDAFATTKPSGMGVGLSLSRTIIENHGGTLSAHNHPAGGAIFEFTLRKALRPKTSS